MDDIGAALGGILVVLGVSSAIDVHRKDGSLWRLCANGAFIGVGVVAIARGIEGTRTLLDDRLGGLPLPPRTTATITTPVHDPRAIYEASKCKDETCVMHGLPHDGKVCKRAAWAPREMPNTTPRAVGML